MSAEEQMNPGLIDSEVMNINYDAGIKRSTYDLPPSSSVTGVNCLAAAVITILPTAPLPV